MATEFTVSKRFKVSEQSVGRVKRSQSASLANIAIRRNARTGSGS